MTKIFKFALAPQINLPVGARILDVQPQGKSLCLWAVVDPTAPVEAFGVLGIGTGDSLPLDGEALRFVKTLQGSDGSVTHIFLRPLGAAAAAEPTGEGPTPSTLN